MIYLFHEEHRKYTISHLKRPQILTVEIKILVNWYPETYLNESGSFKKSHFQGVFICTKVSIICVTSKKKSQNSCNVINCNME